MSLNGISYPLPLRQGVFSTWLTLAEGAKRVEILADGRGLWQTTVNLAAERADATAYRRLHRSHLAGRGACGACHGAERAALTGAAPEPSSDLCFRCHDRFQDKRYVHGPVAVGDCLTCHDPHGGLCEHALRDDRSALCLGCHVEGEMRLCGETADDGSPACTRCHDPHQSDARYLRKAEGPPPRGR